MEPDRNKKNGVGMINLPPFLVVETEIIGYALLFFFGLAVCGRLLAWKYPALVWMRNFAGMALQGFALSIVLIGLQNSSVKCACPASGSINFEPGEEMSAYLGRAIVGGYTYSYSPLKIKGFRQLAPPPRIIKEDCISLHNDKLFKEGSPINLTWLSNPEQKQ